MKFNEVSAKPLTVHLAGSDYLTGVGLAKLLDAADFIEVTGLSTSGMQTIQRVQVEEPDIVLMDAHIANSGHAETTGAISAMACGTKVVTLCPFANASATKVMETAFDAGASSFLVTDLTLEDIAAALRIVHRGGMVSALFPGGRTKIDGGSRTDTFASADPSVLNRFNTLSTRDLQIVLALAEGHTNMQISKQMHLSEATVKARLARIMQQLGFENRVQIAVAAVRAGLRG